MLLRDSPSRALRSAGSATLARRRSRVLADLQPLNAAWRSRSSSVHSLNSARMTSRGSRPASASDRRRVRRPAARSTACASSLALERPGASCRCRCRPRRRSAKRSPRRRQDQRAEVRVSALPGLVADDDDLLFAPDLDLEPAPRAACPARSGWSAAWRRCLRGPASMTASLEVLAVSITMCDGSAPVAVADDTLAAASCAPRAARRQQVPAVEVEEVEDVVDERRRVGRAPARTAGPAPRAAPMRPKPAHAGAVLEQAEVGTPSSSSATTSPSTMAVSALIQSARAARRSGK